MEKNDKNEEKTSVFFGALKRDINSSIEKMQIIPFDDFHFDDIRSIQNKWKMNETKIWLVSFAGE